jgi:hypothetical protein
MDQGKYHLLFLSMILAILLQFGRSGAEAENDQRFEELFLNAAPCRSGLEVSDYRKLKISIEHLPANAEVIGVTQKKLQRKCEARLKQAGIEPVAHKDECLCIKVDLVGDAYTMSIRLSRPILFKANEIVYKKHGAETWQKNIIGLHRGNVRYIFEGLDSLLDDFISEYLKTNSN